MLGALTGLIGTVFGTEKAVSKGLDLIDKAWTTEPEAIAAKTEAKVRLLNARVPFKLSQRVIAWSVTFTVLLCFFVAFIVTTWDFFTAEQIRNAEGKTIVQVYLDLLDAFKLGWAFTAIIVFYFGGGVLEGFQEKAKERDEVRRKHGG